MHSDQNNDHCYLIKSVSEGRAARLQSEGRAASNQPLLRNSAQQCEHHHQQAARVSCGTSTSNLGYVIPYPTSNSPGYFNHRVVEAAIIAVFFSACFDVFFSLSEAPNQSASLRVADRRCCTQSPYPFFARKKHGNSRRRRNVN